MTGISAIVATVNRKSELERLLKSFVSNNYPYLEVIIVDQNKNGLIDQLIEEYKNCLNIIHLKLDVPNQSIARNIGVRHATNEIICFPDDDCWYDNDSLKGIAQFFDSNPNTDLLIINWRQKIRPNGSVSQKISRQTLFSFKAPFHYGTIVLVFKKVKFELLGGFIENIGIGFYIGAGEDSELMFRAAKKGMAIYYESTIYVNHKYTIHRDISSNRVRQRGQGYIYSKYTLYSIVALRGLLSPIVYMLFCLDSKKRKGHFSTFLGRLEGLIYGIRN